jgi:ATP-dependent DNA ligase
VDLPLYTVIDGEIVALDEHGIPSFDILQGLGRRSPMIVMYALDLVMLRAKTCGVGLWKNAEGSSNKL